jgi:hypothetical protein
MGQLILAARFWRAAAVPVGKKTGAEAAPENVPKEEDENRERGALGFHLKTSNCDADA